MSTTAGATLPLDDVMMAMDVVDTLRHRQDLVTRELDESSREKQLIERLREIYHQQGIEVPDHVLREGVDALKESRFVYTPPAPGFGTTLAHLYVTRGSWGRWALAAAVVLTLGLGGYFLGWLPYQASVAEAARVELTQTIPAEMDRLYDAIYTETKVEIAVDQAEEIRTRGRAEVAAGDRAGAESAVTALEALLETLRLDYAIRVVAGGQSGFWTFPELNTDATNYYLVVQAVAPDGVVLSLPIENEEDNSIETVSQWGIGVPKTVYDAVSADKLDNGIIENNILGYKSYGFIEPQYRMPVTGGAVTRW